ncbi:MAG: hypothetical protein ABIN91_16530 [Mucilaginibacter sp.]|uniref:hypothetical protein n=1 Tax=Mucilaginibacter sp. TaxID=1882438 RepID=UPI003267F451
MPNHLSILGIIHTAISILAIFAALYALFRSGKIDPAKSGKLYLWLTIVTCLTGLPIMKTGQPTPGHFLAVIILLILPMAVFAKSIKFFGKAADYIQIGSMSFTLLLSMIPATVETLTRLPISAPLAADANASIITTVLGFWTGLFVIGLAQQLFKLKASKKAEAAQAIT